MNLFVGSYMCRIFAITMIVAACSVFVPVLHAQPCSLSMSVTSAPVDHLGLADVDVEHFESRSLLFTIRISSSGSIPLSAYLHATLMVTLADGSTYPNAVDFTTEPFPVPPGGRTVTNLNIGSSKEIKTQSFSYDEAAKERIREIALGTGSFPAGKYVFQFSLYQVPLPNACDQDNREYDLQNPSRVDLRSPHDGETTTEFPFFEFYQDAGRALLTVAELQPGQSREDAITRKPPMLEKELVGQNSFLYAGGRPLEQGKTYVWQVVSLVRTSGGTDNTIASPIWSFTVSSSGAGTSEDAILNQLEEMYGSQYAPIFEQIRNGHFKLTGKYSDNNSTLTQSELLNLLNELRALVESAELSLE